MPSLVTKLVVGFSTAGVLLIFALAYNLGGTKQAGRNEEMLSQSKERLTTLQNQLLSCKDRNSKIQKGEQSDEAEVLHQEEQISRAHQVKNSLQKEYSNLRKDLHECEAKKKLDRAAATGTTDMFPKETYQKLVAQTAVLRNSLEDVVKKRNATRQELIKLIRTYRMNNLDLISEAKANNINLKASGKVTDNFKSSKLDRGGRVISSGEAEVFIPNQGDGGGDDPRVSSKWANMKKFAAKALGEKRLQQVEKMKIVTAELPVTPPPTTAIKTTAVAGTPQPIVTAPPAIPTTASQTTVLVSPTEAPQTTATTNAVSNAETPTAAATVEQQVTTAAGAPLDTPLANNNGTEAPQTTVTSAPVVAETNAETKSVEQQQTTTTTTEAAAAQQVNTSAPSGPN